MKLCCYENTNNVINTCEVVASELTGVFKKLFGDNVGNNDSAKLYCALPPFKKNSTGFDIVFGCFCCNLHSYSPPYYFIWILPIHSLH